MGELCELRPQREPKVEKPWATNRRDNGYIEHWFCHFYQSEELERDVEGKRKVWQADFETMSKTKAYRNHIKNSELETREVFERETWSPENIQRTLPTDMVTWLDDNQLTRSTYSLKHEETHEPEENPEQEPS